jgi:hypothetical protein
VERLVRWAKSSALLTACALAGCAGSAEVTRPDPVITTAPTIPVTAPRAPNTTAPEAPVAPPAPSLLPPAGPHPSFNESAGCGVLQGYRGPFVADDGDQADDVAIAGPWGDYFGRDIGEVRSHLVLIELPTVGEDTDNKVWVHERVAPALQRVIDNLLEHQLMGFSYRIEVTSSFRPSTVPPHRYLSFHAVGAAIDINPTANPYRADNVLVTDIPEWFVQIWRDAGWCWGGDWQDIKDPMHFSWQGPLHTADYPSLPPSQPRTDPAPYVRSITFPTYLGSAPSGSVHLIADVDRDGAPDAVRVSAWTETGRLGAEAARARHAYSTCWTTGVTERPALPGAALLLADRTGDGRPDLWEIGVNDDAVTILVHAFASGYRTAMHPIVVPVAVDQDSVYLTADHNQDGVTDLYIVRPRNPVRVDIFAGPAFEPMLGATLPIAASSEWRFTLGDYDGDAVPDLYALGPGDHAVVMIAPGSGSFTAAPLRLETRIGEHSGAVHATDLDGDGRDDLMFFDPDGSLTTYLGGDAGDATDADLISWFFAGWVEPWADGQPWTPGSGCRIVPGAPVRR